MRLLLSRADASTEQTLQHQHTYHVRLFCATGFGSSRLALSWHQIIKIAIDIEPDKDIRKEDNACPGAIRLSYVI